MDVLNEIVHLGVVPVFYHADLEPSKKIVIACFDGGPGFVKSTLDPTPWTRVMVTGGVEATQESISTWFKAGVTAMGIGSNLIRKRVDCGR